MTDGQHEGGVVGWGAPPSGSPDPSIVGQPTPGWYPDPWASGQHRYWNGQNWTGDAFPHGPAGSSSSGSFSFAGEPRSVTIGPPPPPPEWSPPTGSSRWPNPPTTPHPPVGPDQPGRPPRRHILAILLLVPLIVGFSSFAGFYFATRRTAKPAAQTTAPTSPPLTTTPPSDPSAAVLSGLVVTQRDVGSAASVQLEPNGDQVGGTPTLDLCNGTYPSESLRKARLQVDAVDAQGNPVLSTEAVLYANSAATAQAFSELTAVTTGCPATPVTSQVGDQTVTTHFNPPPDGAWPQVASVQRLAFDFVVTDQSGQTQHSIAVYLRRGRVLMGVYFNQPDTAQAAVAGQTTIPGIVNVFATRIAQLPASAVNG